MKRVILVGLAMSALTFAGCETTSSRPYSPSTSNIVSIKDTLGPSGTKVGLTGFSVAEGVDDELTCRAMGALDVGSGKTPVEFIEEAFKTEMFQAGVFSSDSTNKITGTLTQFEADSWGEGSWDLGLKLTSDRNPTGYEVTTNTTFKSSFSAIKACQNVVDAFTPAVQKLIGDAVAHPDFEKLAK